MKKVLDLKTDIRGDIWASGEPENLINAHDNHFQEALANIAFWVNGEKQDNVNLARFCKTYYKMGMTVIPMPKGVVTRIFTVANEDYTDPVFYRQTRWPEPEAWARNLFLFPKPALTDLAALPMGFQFADAGNDSLYGRARTGIWAQYQGNIYIAPWIQSNELVVIEWVGVKEKFEDGDLVNPAINYRKAVKLYVQFAHERDYGDTGRAMFFKNPQVSGQFDEALADLIIEDKQQKEIQNLDTGGHERNRLCSELADDAPITPADGVIIADVGNISLPGDDLDNVERLVRSWGAKSVIGSGLIAGALTDYDASAGNSFHDFIQPYGGIHGPGAATKAFFPAPSAADWTKDGLATLISFFGVSRYYNVIIGDVHLFVIDSSASEPDGNTSASAQGVWLQAQLALSTAPWKIVLMDLCPWGSLYSNASLQWPFASWGADLVICGQARNYERMNVAGLPVINNGLGGKTTIEPVLAPLANTEAAYAEKFGAGKISANLHSLIYEFFNVDGDLIDKLSLAK